MFSLSLLCDGHKLRWNFLTSSPMCDILKFWKSCCNLLSSNSMCCWNNPPASHMCDLRKFCCKLVVCRSTCYLRKLCCNSTLSISTCNFRDVCHWYLLSSHSPGVFLCYLQTLVSSGFLCDSRQLRCKFLSSSSLCRSRKFRSKILLSSSRFLVQGL